MTSFVAVWGASTDEDVARAQGRKPVVITRIYTGPDGLAHAEDIELKLNARGISDMLKATGAEFSVRAPTPGANPNKTAASAANDPDGTRSGASVRHHAGREFRRAVAVAVHVRTSRGHINLIEDTTGKGHFTRNLRP